jgi:threonine dehydrogenase-like Zn-dependent dehydrogenase
LTSRGISTGSPQDHRDVLEFLGGKRVDLSKLVDKVFSFEQARDAFEYVYQAKHFGKVVIKV